MEDKKVLLSIKDLQVKFRVRGRILTAIRGVTLDIYENESIAIVGESGAGNSQKRLQECWTATASSIREISFLTMPS